MHWIGAQVCVCMFLDFRDKFFNMLIFFGALNENEKTKKEQKERPCSRIRLQFTKYTIGPRNEN